MKRYFRSFRLTFPGYHSIWAAALLIFGVFSLVYALGVSHWLPIRNFVTNLDAQVMEALLNERGLARSSVFLFFTYLANWEVILTLSIAIIAIMLLARKVRAATFFIITLGLGQSSSLLFKYLLQRDRPDTGVALINQSGYSFPSGHALGAFMFYGILGYFLYVLAQKRWLKTLCVLLTALVIALIGLSRMYLGVHWLSDVAAGWLMGATLLIVFITFFEHRKRLFPTIHRAPYVSNRTILICAIIVALAEALFIWNFYTSHPLKKTEPIPFPHLVFQLAHQLRSNQNG